jgi:hypothetical protein
VAAMARDSPSSGRRIVVVCSEWRFVRRRAEALVDRGAVAPYSPHVTCPQCGYDDAWEMTFCGECGTRLAVLCAACGARNAPRQEFCGERGARLTGAPSAVTQRSPQDCTPEQGTVLFADLKGSMELLARTGWTKRGRGAPASR